MFHLRFLLREIREAGSQAGVFILCVALSITTLVALNSFKRDVSDNITGDARGLHGGDLILHAHNEFSPGLLAEVSRIGDKVVDRVRTWEFYSVARHPSEESTLFSNIKVVGPAYPLYGAVELESGRKLNDALKPGATVVARALLDKLGLKVGDLLMVGKAALVITDVVTRESSRPVDIFQFGPRIFVAAADLDTIDLVKQGSRVEHELLLKITDEDDLIWAEERLKQASMSRQERISTYKNARSGLKRFFDNLLFFLSLISIFTLLLAGIGMQSSLMALLRNKEKSLAIIKSLGATRSFLFLHYLVMVLGLGFLGGLLGLVAAMMIKGVFPLLFASVLPVGAIGGLGVADVVEGLVLSFLVVVFFAFLPVYRLQRIKPNVIFRNESETGRRSPLYYFAMVAGVLLLTVLVIRQLEDVRTGLYFMAGSLGLILLITLLTYLLLKLLANTRVRPLALRQAVRSLLRPGNATRSVVVTLASALSVLLMIFLVEYNLHRTYVESYPQEAPNLFMVDIQPDQVEGFKELMSDGVQLHPIIRARLKSINGEQIRRGQKKSRWSDSLSREFNLTYRNDLLADEVVTEGDGLFTRDENGGVPIQVSVLDMVADLGDMRLGDILEFNIQGVVVRAKITSIRTRNKSMLYPFFYFVFPEEYLKKAPQTLFAAIHVPEDEISVMEAKVVSRYPNISVINMAATAVELGKVMEKLSRIVNFFALFSILAGALIIVSSILATRMARLREVVYYKVLGGSTTFVIRVFWQESLLLGLMSSSLGVVLAQLGSWALCAYLFEIEYTPNLIASAVLVGLNLILVSLVGMAGSMGIIRQKPITFLREQSIE